MNPTTVLLTVLYAMALACTGRPDDTPKFVEALKPPEAKKGEPIVFEMAEYDVKEWKAKTKDGAAPWFKVDGDRWYVDWDAERLPFDVVMIHHSVTATTATPDEIDAVGKDHLYPPPYRSSGDDPFVKGLPVHSGHVINGKERFIGYHHLVYADGTVTTELSPLVKVDDTWFVDHVGWHAGKRKDPEKEDGWHLNCHSVAICLVGDFSNKEPPDAQLRATAGLIVHYRGFNPKLTVIGHSDHAATECPGKTWHIWRKKMLALAGVHD